MGCCTSASTFRNELLQYQSNQYNKPVFPCILGTDGNFTFAEEEITFFERLLLLAVSSKENLQFQARGQLLQGFSIQDEDFVFPNVYDLPGLHLSQGSRKGLADRSQF
jgi:hypothetical protein